MQVSGLAPLFSSSVPFSAQFLAREDEGDDIGWVSVRRSQGGAAAKGRP